MSGRIDLDPIGRAFHGPGSPLPRAHAGEHVGAARCADDSYPKSRVGCLAYSGPVRRQSCWRACLLPKPGSGTSTTLPGDVRLSWPAPG